MASAGRLGILVGGGPAPGINSVISSATIEARNSGLRVVGMYDGFQHLMEGDLIPAVDLDIPDVSRIHTQGGSILRISRANPTKAPELMAKTVASLRRLGVAYLVSIGGDDTATSASEVAGASGGSIRVAHVPKTIDNDLPLPAGLSTFGFQTARHVGTEQVLNLAEEARTSNRWVFVVVMGRKAGHLALGIGKAAGATLTIIPEELPDKVTLDDIAAILEGAIIKRRTAGQEHGVAVMAEGMVEKLDPKELARITGADISHDPHGHIRLEEIPIGAVLRRLVTERCAVWNKGQRITDVTLGYTLRCAPPIPFDIDYTRTLGYGAVRFLLSDPKSQALREGGMVTLVEGQVEVAPFSELIDPATGRMRVRLINTESEHFRVAQEYMIRLDREDIEDPEKLKRLALTARVTSDEFARKFGPVVAIR